MGWLGDHANLHALRIWHIEVQANPDYPCSNHSMITGIIEDSHGSDCVREDVALLHPTPNDESIALIERLISNWEDETVEFKEANDNFKTDDIGRYVSALSNEANLAGLDSAWLVFGVRNKDHSVVGTNYRTDRKRLDLTKKQIFDGTIPGFPLRGVFEVNHPEGRIVVFEIPPAPQGIPISWKGHFYSRAGENLVYLPIEKLDAIRAEESLFDWTAQTIDDAELSDLSPEALFEARRAFKEKNSPRIPSETIDSWGDAEFLAHLGLATRRGITRAAILLLGKPESSFLLSPHSAEITWKLMEEERAYEHFTIPFVLSTTQLYARIRNYKLRLLSPGELIQREVEKYDQGTVLEAIHNCIAHQDYSQHSRIAVYEHVDRLVFVSQGSFFEGNPDDYAIDPHMPRRYRNTTLVMAMTELGMIDHLGYGIEKMNRSQAKRYLPLPEYDLSSPEEVKLTIWGSVVDEAYTRMLMHHTDLPFDEVMALDRIQKGQPVADDMLRRLRRKNLIEGRRPHLRVAASVAEATGTKVTYLEQRGQTDEWYMALIHDHLRKDGPLARGEIVDLIQPHMPAGSSREQCINKVDNLMRKMKSVYAAKPKSIDGKRVWTLT